MGSRRALRERPPAARRMRVDRARRRRDARPRLDDCRQGAATDAESRRGRCRVEWLGYALNRASAVQTSPPADLDRALHRLLRLIPSAHQEVDALAAAGDAASTSAALDRIADWLYQSWYCVPDPEPAASPPALGRSDLVSALRASLPASSRWEAGWVVMKSAQNGTCVAGRRAEIRELRLGEYVNVARPGVPPMPGDAVAVSERIDVVDQRTGFWSTRSRPGEPSSPLVRLYW